MSIMPNTYERNLPESSTSMGISTAVPSPVATLPCYRRCRPAILRMSDPVCGKMIHPNEFSQVRDGTTFYFCSAHCRRKFMPAAILERTYRLTWTVRGHPPLHRER